MENEVQEAPDTANDLHSDTSIDVGARLKSLRQVHGYSQRELAKRAGITNGAISLIEQNEVSPSIASLKKVLSGFPVSLAEFFSPEPQPRAQVFYRAEELTELAGGPVSLRQIGSNFAGRKLQVLHEHYKPDSGTGQDMLTHEGEEAGIVVAGQCEVTIGSQRRILSPGDAYYFDSRVPHRFHNPGPEPCEIISVCTPPTF